MTETRAIAFLPRFDYVTFYDQHIFTDCEIHISLPNGQNDCIKAHRAVLSSNSDFFRNVFTAGGVEEKTGIVKNVKNSLNLLPRVIRFLYNGELDFTDDEVPILYEIANHCGIKALIEQLTNHVSSPAYANQDGVLSFVSGCYEHECPQALLWLEPLIATNYDAILMQNLSRNLDCIVFSHVLKRMEKMTAEKKINEINLFLSVENGDFTLTEADKQALSSVFDRPNEGLKASLKKNAWWIGQ